MWLKILYWIVVVITLLICTVAVGFKIIFYFKLYQFIGGC